MNKILWQPDATTEENCHLTKFMAQIEAKTGLNFDGDYFKFHDWTIEQNESFWDEFWQFADIRAQSKGNIVFMAGDKRANEPMFGAKFFPEAKLNFAENLLKRRDDAPALIFQAEDKVSYQYSFAQLYEKTIKLACYLRKLGVKKGDVVAGFIPNMPEAIIAMLATTALGGVWRSCSPDFAKSGVLDRFSQSRPKILFCADGYYYNGKSHDSLSQVASWVEEIDSIEAVLVIPVLEENPNITALQAKKTCLLLGQALSSMDDGVVDEFTFTPCNFNDPLYIMYSSGTTGKPKCIIHCVGGILLMHMKEHLLQCNNRENDRLLFFTTCGWMMWNWLVSALGVGACLMLYDGSPFYPSGYILYEFATKHQCNLFGVSAKFFDACAKQKIHPQEHPQLAKDLQSLRMICSTGSPLHEDGFEFVYQHVKPDIHLASITGGTDLVGCLMAASPILPVHCGELQAACLGLDVVVVDDDGKEILDEKGELVCRNPFPSMPIGFLNDDGDERYRAAYFTKYPNWWTHGDFCLKNGQTGGFVVYGRSDATLNPGGVRIGTAELYVQVESFPQIAEAIVIGQEWQNDTRIILFVRMQAGQVLDDTLIASIKQRIKNHCTPRHVPAKIIEIADIPRTRSGKITEIAVRDVIHNRTVKNTEALANPEALEYFKNLPELQD